MKLMPRPTGHPAGKPRLRARTAALTATAVILPLGLFASQATASSPAAPARATAATGLEGPPLQDVIDKPVGTAVREHVLRQSDTIGEQYRQVAAEQFSMLVPESELKFNRLHSRVGADPANPVAADFNLALPQPILDAAEANGQEVRGHTFVWYQANPAWLLTGAYSSDELLEIMRGHIKFVAHHYREDIKTWDVVNEALAADGTLREPCNPTGASAGAECGRSGTDKSNSVWQRIGGSEDFTHIVEAFRTARENLPASAKLFYNDFGIERSGPKADGALALVKMLQNETAVTADGETKPLIDGIGFQTHIGVDWTPAYVDDFRTNMKRFTDLGLESQITELDVSMTLPPTQAQLATQKRVYQDIGQLCAQEPACTAILVWGFTDRFQWIAERPNYPYGAPAVLDADFQPKPAFEGFRTGLATPPTAPGAAAEPGTQGKKDKKQRDQRG